MRTIEELTAECELDAAFHMYRSGIGPTELPASGVVEWAKAHYQMQHRMLTVLFVASVQSTLKSMSAANAASVPDEVEIDTLDLDEAGEP